MFNDFYNYRILIKKLYYLICIKDILLNFIMELEDIICSVKNNKLKESE